jgi:hypothetical protein
MLWIGILRNLLWISMGVKAYWMGEEGNLLVQSFNKLPPQSGGKSRGWGHSYDCLDMVRITNMILSKGDKVTD